MAPGLLIYKCCQGCIAKSWGSKSHALNVTLRCFTAVQLMQQAQGAQLCHCSPQGVACSMPITPSKQKHHAQWHSIGAGATEQTTMSTSST